jgi:hypothetical protein
VIESDTERLLRESLHRRAERAPDAAQLAERIVAEARSSDGRVVRRSFRWQTWATPLVTAAAVAAVAVAVVKAPTPHSGGSQTAAGTGSVGSPPPRQYAASASARAAAASASARADAASAASSAARAASSAASSAVRAAGGSPAALSGFRVSDVTFVSDTEGWAIGTARCLNGSGARCPAMMHTADGRTWTSMPTPPIGAGHQQLRIRFATDKIGYAYDPSVLFMTQDGGRTWQRQPGGAVALETLDGNVARVVSPHSGCPGPCDVRVQIAPIGTSAWKSVPVSGGRIDAAAVQLARADNDIYLLAQQHASVSAFVVLADTGDSSQSRGEPCSSVGPGYAAVAVDAAPGRQVAVLCRSADGQAAERVAVSSDAGGSFAPRSGTLPPRTLDLLSGDPRGVLLAGGTDVYRSADGGRSWARVPGLGSVRFLGFESTDVARAVSTDGATVWTTSDGGLHWQASRFG